MRTSKEMVKVLTECMLHQYYDGCLSANTHARKIVNSLSARTCKQT